MKKSDRLAKIIKLMQESNAATTTADYLAQKLNVSTRTIYRDISTLIKSGLPVIGEAGTGYTLQQHHNTAPITLNAQEREALLLGAHMIKSWSDQSFSDAASSAINKIISASQGITKDTTLETTLFYPPSKTRPEITIDITLLRSALKNKNTIEFEHILEDTQTEHRTINPIGIAFFGPSWMLVGWCADAEKFCNFRLENMKQLTITHNHFSDLSCPTLDDFIQIMQGKHNHDDEANHSHYANATHTGH